ncbi:unannotated protein [freshwater metagenome]|uniref:Unannotated protein n=1 Tax=freshwater metagenome TaxID=449393 RepID=A0A6J6RYP5_9ZZZZ
MAALELLAVTQGSGNLQFRVLQLAVPGLILFAVLGWARVLGRATLPRVGRWAGAVVAVTAAAAVIANLTTVALSTSFDRARSQHLDDDFTSEVAASADEVDGELTVVAPRLTDQAALSLLLEEHPEVQFPSIQPSTYVGPVPRWDRQPDSRYVVAPGASVLGEADYLARDGDYGVVELGETGAIVSPILGGWTRTTWMRGLPCARAGVRLLVVRGGTGRQTFRVASRGRAALSAGVELTTEDGRRVPVAERPQFVAGWTVQTYRAPRTTDAILTVMPAPQLVATSTTTFPVVVGDAESLLLGQVDDGLVDACLSDPDSGMDGYDRELTYMRTAP